MTGRPHPDRRLVLAGAAAVLAAPAGAQTAPSFTMLEARSGGRLGVHAVNLVTGKRLAHRADERFAMCSTFKALAAAAVLARVDAGQERLDRGVPITRADMRPHAPVTETYLDRGQVSLEALCKAAVEQSDNPAANLMLKTVGGPEGLTAWLRGIGDRATRLDRWETELNSAIKGDPRDTTTPAAMTATLGKLAVGEVLKAASREKLVGWMIASPTGANRLRKHLPAGWRAGDKTGTGANGSTNDVAVFWPPTGGPIVVACYITETSAELAVREGVMAEVGRIVAQTLV
ncbi:class A beta-lactamase [Phenylobacterium deserti]|uniref:Beta-lactamase n=1 Tax=Phenylobacterium deserti TaxID=1914756 RepID=A0A328AQU5_9CAUL|nr:class A beta-lactamase [Phenylobacterium deserti]RAK56621.1 class A beta-lactamase [Phenylobacterium deserti]